MFLSILSPRLQLSLFLFRPQKFIKPGGKKSSISFPQIAFLRTKLRIFPPFFSPKKNNLTRYVSLPQKSKASFCFFKEEEEQGCSRFFGTKKQKHFSPFSLSRFSLSISFPLSKSESIFS